MKRNIRNISLNIYPHHNRITILSQNELFFLEILCHGDFFLKKKKAYKIDFLIHLFAIVNIQRLKLRFNRMTFYFFLCMRGLF